MAQKRILKIGVVGIGRMGQRHATNILYHTPRAKLIAACSPAKADLDWGAEELVPHGVLVVATFEEMIATPGLEAVVVASLSELHASQTLECIKRGIHVLCEKPISKSVEEVGRTSSIYGERMLTLCKLVRLIDQGNRKPEVKVMVGFTRRFDESYADAAGKIKAGQIGAPVVIRSQGCEKYDPSPFMASYLANSGGIFVDSIIHDIDLALSFFGDDSQPKSVWAAGTTTLFTDLAKSGDADNAVGICEFWDGKIAYFYNSRTAAHGYDNQTEIFGTAGKLSVNLIARKNRLEIADAGGVRVEATPSWINRYESAFVTEINAFVGAVLDDQPMPIPLKTALTSLRIAVALQHSLKTGDKVAFDREGNRVDGAKL